MSIIRRVWGNLRSLALPIFCIVVSGGLIFIFRGLGATSSRRAELMQVELNHQFDLFQSQLAENHDQLVQMQERAFLAEKVRDNLNELFSLSQRDLLATQKALNAANAGLLKTQEALAQAINDRTIKLSPLESDENQKEALKEGIEELFALKRARRATEDLIALDQQRFQRVFARSQAIARVLRSSNRSGHDSTVTSPESAVKEDQNILQATAPITPEDDSLDSEKELRMKGIEFIKSRIAERSIELVELNDQLVALHSAMLATEKSIASIRVKLNQGVKDGP